MMRHRHQFAVFVVTATLVMLTVAFGRQVWAAGEEKATDERPNIVVVLVDDLRWDEIGAAGHPYVSTPNIDRIAHEGASFSRAFTTTPLCSPARASMLTGQYAHLNGITDNLARDAQSHKLETFPKALHEAGYETAFIGKWHMGNDDSPRAGFSFWAAMKGQGEALNPTLNVDGVRKPFTGYVTDILTDLAVDFVRRPRTSPFLLYLSHKALHPNITQYDDGSSGPSPSGVPGFIPAERHRGRYADEAVPRRPNAGVAPIDKPALMRRIGDLPPLGEPTMTPVQDIHDRQEMLLAVDDSLGRIVETIKAAGKLDNTIIVFTSDHGYWYGEHGLNEERRLAYEEALRIPLLIRYPRAIAGGQRPAQLVLSIDVAPTLLEYAGVSATSVLQGRSLVPILAGDSPDWRDSFLVEYYSDTVFERIFHMGYKAVRTNRYKYIEYTDLDGMDELYDLDADPYELRNVIGDPGYARTLAEMQAELKRLLDATS